MKVTKEFDLKNDKEKTRNIRRTPIFAQRGITLIALIITIIVILILVTITILMAINGGLFKQAGNATKETHNAINAERELANEAITIGNTYYNSIDEYFANNKQSIRVSVKLFDEINEKDVGVGTAILEETAILSSENLILTDGYELYSSIDNSISNPTVTIENGKATENSYTVKIIKRNSNGNIIVENATAFNKVRSFLNEKFVLANNIDLSEYSLWTPIGWTDSEDVPFTGELDGNGKTISTLKCNYSSSSATNVGLFAINSGTIKNLNLETKAVYGDTNIGIITGNNTENGRIENCHVSGPIGTLSSYGGGGSIAGSNSGTIFRCSARSDVIGYFWTGGIAGQNYGTIEQTYFIGNVNDRLTDNQIINAKAKYIGGIVGGTTGTIKDSYAILTGEVKGYAGVGGIAGWYNNATIINVYCAGRENVYGAEYTKFDLGYTPGGTSSIAGIYTFETTTTGLTSIPNQFDSNIWDMNGTYESCPNLINNKN